ncbi:MAG: hypothetical protein R3D45_13560 [Rhizobiaceae bacterium]
MHVLLGLLGILAAAAIWWWRLKTLGEAANVALDTIGRARGNMRRRQLRRLAEQSPITAIDDPVVAAATILVAIHSEDGGLDPEREAVIGEALSAIAPAKARDEALIYAKWAVSQVPDTPFVIDRAGGFLASRLNGSEKAQLVEIARGIAAHGNAPVCSRPCLERLQRRLGLVVTAA